MTKQDIEHFIQIMKTVHEDWTPEQVEKTFGSVSLREALDIHMGKLDNAISCLGGLAADMRAQIGKKE